MRMPYYGYARQDRKGEVVSLLLFKLVANIIEKAGASRMIAITYSSSNSKIFDIPIDHLIGVPILSNYFLEKLDPDNTVVVSPDHGGVTRARKMADRLKTPIAIIDKRRRNLT